MESKKEHERKKKAEADARAARLARLFEDDDEDDDDVERDVGDIMDRGAALKGLGHLYDRVNVHLKVEK